MHIREVQNKWPEFVTVIYAENAADGKDESFGAWHTTTKHILTNLQCVLISAISLLREYFAAWGDRDSVVGIATHYGLDGSEIELRCGWGILCSLYPSRLPLGRTQLPVRCIKGLYGREWQWTPTPIKCWSQCIGLYLCSSSVFMACYRQTFTFVMHAATEIRTETFGVQI